MSNYINYISDEWWKSKSAENILNENDLKSFIIEDLKEIGADVTLLKFHVKIYGLHKFNIRVFYRNEYTKMMLDKLTKKQIERKLKLDKLGFDFSE